MAKRDLAKVGPSDGPGAYWDTRIPGLGLLVYPARNGEPGVRTYVVQRERGGRTIRIKLGRTPPVTLAEARRKGREVLARIALGEDPRGERATLEAALGWHLASMRAKECTSVGMFEQETRLHLGDWLERRLAAITPGEVARRHEVLTIRSGPYLANRVVRNLRRIWRTARRRLRGLPDPPTDAVTYNKEHRRREPIPWAELPAWRARVEAIANPVRRDLTLFYLFTGLRKTDGATVRWEDVDLDAGTVHRPRPKGGADHAFTVPVSSPVLEILRRRRAENAGDAGWVFPTVDSRGRTTHVRKPEDRGLPTPHRLRDTFATAALEAGVDPISLKVLMNHTLPAGGDVTAGYIRPSLEHLRAAVEKVAGFLLERMGGTLVGASDDRE